MQKPAAINAISCLSGERLLLGGNDHRLRLYSLGTGAVLQDVKGKNHDIQCLAVSRDERWAAVGHGSWGGVHLWDLNTGELRWAHPAQMYIKAVAFSPEGERVFVGKAGNHVQVMDVASGEVRAEHGDDSTSCDRFIFSPECRLFIVGREGTLTACDALTGREVWCQPEAHMGAISALAVSPGGRFLASGGGDGKVRVWELTTGIPYATLVPNADEVQGVEDALDLSIQCLAFSRSGGWVASGAHRHAIRIWDLRTRVEVAGFIPESTLLGLTCLSFGETHARLVAGTRSGRPLVFAVEAEAGTPAEETRLLPGGSTPAAAVSSPGRPLERFELRTQEGYLQSEALRVLIGDTQTPVNQLLEIARALVQEAAGSPHRGSPVGLLWPLYEKVREKDAVMARTLAAELLGSVLPSSDAIGHDSRGELIPFARRLVGELLQADVTQLPAKLRTMLVRAYSQVCSVCAGLNIGLDCVPLGLHLLMQLMVKAEWEAVRDALVLFCGTGDEAHGPEGHLRFYVEGGLIRAADCAAYARTLGESGLASLHPSLRKLADVCATLGGS
ncbi:MAG TPA: PQQ-binding-like beta-propeller repeat protein [Archangium sp.]|nr:PQQ-binding-like beta-propeller repeat protein [Archangium sp.]